MLIMSIGYYLSEGEKVIIDRSNTLCIIAASSGEDKVMEYYDLNSRELEVELADTANWESRLHRELELFVANDLEKEIGVRTNQPNIIPPYLDVPSKCLLAK